MKRISFMFKRNPWIKAEALAADPGDDPVHAAYLKQNDALGRAYSASVSGKDSPSSYALYLALVKEVREIHMHVEFSEPMKLSSPFRRG